MRSSFALLAAGSLAITALGRLVDFETAPEVNTGSGDSPLTAELLGGGNPDVVVWDLQSYQNYTPSGGYHAYALGTTSCNQGDVPLLWQSNTNLHPVIGQNMYRWKDGRFEQIGMGWLKHGFYALSLSDCGPCQGTDGTTLGINCSDPYTASRNGSQGGLGPKYQVNATTGYFPYPPANPSYSGSTARRCRVPSSDVIPSENPGAVYFMEGQYVCPDDSPDDTGDASNNSSHRRLNMASSGAISSFAGPTIQELPAIASWDDLDPEVDLHEIEIPGEGTVWFGSRVFDEGNGTYRYEYAIFNLNVDRSIGSLRLPWDPSNVANVAKHKAPEWHSGEMFTNESWDMSISGGEMVWSADSYTANEMANAVRWANLQNITIITEAEPTIGNVTLDFFKPGSPENLQIQTNVPGTSIPVEAACCFFDGSCTTDFANDCTSAGGDYQGSQVVCASDPCEQPTTGACCIGIDCTDLGPAACAAAGGTSAGLGTRCSDNGCAPQACCLSSGDCLSLLPATCLAVGGSVESTECASASCSTPSCESDVDNDGFVNFNDLIQVLSRWGDCLDCPEDIDASGTVDFNDVLSLLSFWGEC